MAGFDVIVVGARVAGAATAMLLARAGVRVLVLDAARFGSDTVSSHQVQLPGIALLARWGLLDALIAAGTPPTRTVRFDAGTTAFTGSFPSCDGVDALYSPRRTVLDALLVQAARDAGAQVRERVRVERLERDGAGRVVGVAWRGAGGQPVIERARLVIGADGKHSTVARLAGARPYRVHSPRAFASYGYFAGLPVQAGELYHRPGRAVAVFPTNHDATMVYVAGPLAEFPAFRADPAAAHLATLDRCGDLGERVRAATRVDHLRTTPDQPNGFRVPYGPGWALVGDAGVVMDSVTAAGISNALRDASGLAEAIVDGLGGAISLETALRRHHRRRDRSLRPMFDLTLRLARFEAPGFAARRFYDAVGANPAEITRFLGTFSGVTPLRRYAGLWPILRHTFRRR